MLADSNGDHAADFDQPAVTGPAAEPGASLVAHSFLFLPATDFRPGAWHVSGEGVHPTGSL
jgi:hypothetical protein